MFSFFLFTRALIILVYSSIYYLRITYKQAKKIRAIKGVRQISLLITIAKK